MDGYIFTINGAIKISSINGEGIVLPENSNEVAQGTEVKLPDVWGTTVTRNISTSTRIRSIIN